MTMILERNLQKVPVHILSRCQPYPFGHIVSFRQVLFNMIVLSVYIISVVIIYDSSLPNSENEKPSWDGLVIVLVVAESYN